MKAIFRGGPLDGKEREVQDDQLELLIEQSGGTPVRYVRHLLDKRGVAYYSIPTSRPQQRGARA